MLYAFKKRDHKIIVVVKSVRVFSEEWCLVKIQDSNTLLMNGAKSIPYKCQLFHCCTITVYMNIFVDFSVKVVFVSNL